MIKDKIVLGYKMSPISRPENIEPFSEQLIGGELTRVAHILLKEGQSHGNVIAGLVTDHGMTIATATNLVVRMTQQSSIRGTVRTGVRFDLPDVGDIITFAGERLWLPLDKPDNEPLERPAGDEVLLTRCVPSAPNICYIEVEFGGVTYGSDLILDDGSIKGIVKIEEEAIGGRPSGMAMRDQRSRQAFVPDFRDVNIEGEGLGDGRVDESGEALNDAMQLAPGGVGFVNQGQGEAISLTEPFSDIGYADNVVEDSDRDKVMDVAGKRAQSINAILPTFQENGLYPISTNYDTSTDIFYASFIEQDEAEEAGQLVSNMFDIEVEVDVSDDIWSIYAPMPIDVAAKKRSGYTKVTNFGIVFGDPGARSKKFYDILANSDYKPREMDAGLGLAIACYDKEEDAKRGKKLLEDADFSWIQLYNGEGGWLLSAQTVIVSDDPDDWKEDATPDWVDESESGLRARRSYTDRQINRSKPLQARGGSWWLVTAKEGDSVKEYVVQSRSKEDIKIKQASVESIMGPFTMQVAIDNSTDGKPTIMVSRRKRAENPEQHDYWTQNTDTVGPVRAEDEEEETELDSYGVVSE